MTPVIVVWEDAVKDTDYSGASDLAGKTAICHDIGYFIKKTRKMVVIAGGRDQDIDDIRWVMTIPTVLVREIIILEPKNAQ